MTLLLSTVCINASLDAIETAIGAPAVLKLRSGAMPANVAAADSGTVLATIALPSDWLAAATNREKVKAGIWSGIGDAAAGAGTNVGHFRIYASNGTTAHMQGTVVAGADPADGQLALSNINIASGQSVTISAFSIAESYTPAVGNIVIEGDSILAYTSPPSYARLWAADNIDQDIYNLAVGGSSTATMVARQSAALAYNPTHLFVGIGANDLGDDTAAYLTALWAYTDQFKALGAKVIIMTVLPKTGGTNWSTRRANFRVGILEAIGTKIDDVVDFNASPMGIDGAENNAAYYPDGLHPSATGFDLLKRIFAPVANYAIGKANEPLDLTFAPQAAGIVDTDYDSANYTVAGLYAGESRPYSVSTGASVSKNNGAFVLNGTGTVVNGDTLKVRNRSSAAAAMATNVTLTIGTTSATYTVTTAGAGSRDWVPTDLGAKLRLWTRPEGLTETVADAQINAWADESGNAVAVTGIGTFKPRLQLAAINGFKATNYLGTEQNAFSLPADFLTGRSESSTFVVAKNNLDPNTTYFAPPVGGWGTDATGEFYPFTNGDIYSSYAIDIRRQIPVTPSLASWRFVSFHSKASDWRYYVDGTNVFTTASNTFAVGSAAKIGRAGAEPFAGQVAEVIDCNSVLTTTERQLVEGYLAWKYGLQANLPGVHPYAAEKPTI